MNEKAKKGNMIQTDNIGGPMLSFYQGADQWERFVNLCVYDLHILKAAG